MSCKEEKLSKKSIASLGSAYATTVSDIKEIQERLITEKVKLERSPVPIRDQIILPESTLTVSSKAVALGKRLITIDNSNFGPSLKSRLSGEEAFLNTVEGVDGVRLFAGKYWSFDDTGKSLKYIDNVNGAAFEITDYNFTNTGTEKIVSIPKTAMNVKNLIPSNLGDIVSKIGSPPAADTRPKTQAQKDNKGTFFGTQQWLLLRANKRRFMIEAKSSGTPFSVETAGSFATAKNAFDLSTLKFSEEQWTAFIAGGLAGDTNTQNIPTAIDQGVDYYDHTHEIDMPFSSEELELVSLLNNPAHASFEANYNFYVEEYEENLVNIDEKTIPNAYETSIKVIEDVGGNIDKNSTITLGGELKIHDASFISTKIASNTEGAIATKYFKKFGLSLNNLSKPKSDENKERQRVQRIETIEKATENNSNVIIPMDAIPALKEYESKKNLFPMNVVLDFSTDRTTRFAETLKDAKMSALFMKDIIGLDGRANILGEMKFVDVKELMSQVKTVTGGNITTRQYNFARHTKKVWDISEWIKLLDKSANIENFPTPSIVLGQGQESNLANMSSQIFVKTISKLVLLGKLRQIAKDKFRTYREVLAGKMAYSETVFYRVEKVESVSGQTIQNIYLPNSNEIDVLTYIDTQVKYDKKYKYRLYAYQFVVGNKYSYSELTTEGDLASVLVTQVPSTILVESQIFEQEVIVLDDPPVSPDVDFIPYKNVNNELLINLNGNVGDYMLEPIIIEDGDEEKIEKFKKRKMVETEKEIRFKSDDHSSQFEVFRLDGRMPSSYKDFSGHLRHTINADINFETEMKATSAAIIDDLEPNTKYYYTVRVVDIHGHRSNPSAVFEVELVDDGGAMYSVIEVFEFSRAQKKKPAKQGRRYIQIKPAFGQTIINKEKSGLEGKTSASEVRDVHLGIEDIDVWSKKYKIRIISKKTGKKIDLNVNCLNNIVKVDLDKQ